MRSRPSDRWPDRTGYVAQAFRPVRAALKGCATVILVAVTAAQAPYQIAAGWGTLPDGLKWGLTAGMAIDKNDHVYAFTRAEPPLIVLDKDGKVLRTWGDKMFAS